MLFLYPRLQMENYIYYRQYGGIINRIYRTKIDGWEKINNSDFNRIEFEAVKNQTGPNNLVLTSKRCKKHPLTVMARGCYHLIPFTPIL
ncbi:Uncharacterised protein [Staphylococcus devriesei]|nr:Uncharacterised protein [Staphylococcus devriesei]